MDRYAQISAQLFSIIQAKHSLTDILNFGEEILGFALGFSSATLQQIATSSNYPVQDIEERIQYLQKATISDYYKEIFSEYSTVPEGETYIVNIPATYRRMFSRVCMNGVVLGNLSILEIHTKLEACDKEIVKCLCKACAISFCLQYANYNFTANSDVESSIFESIIKNYEINQSYIFNRAKLFPIGNQSNYLILSIEISNIPPHGTINLLKDIFEIHKISFWAVAHNSYIIGLVGFQEKYTFPEAEFQVLLKRLSLRAGISDLFDNILESRFHFNMAANTLKYAETEHSEETLCYFNNYKAYEIFHTFSTLSPDFEPYYASEIKQIAAYDKEKKLNYLETLETYLSCNKNIVETSKKLFIHKNTAIYRIAKIGELFHLNFHDAEVLFRLQFTFKLKNFNKSPNRGGKLFLSE